MTDLFRPRDLHEATAIRNAHPDWMLLAGATDLMVTANHKPVPAGIIDIWRLPALCFVRVTDTVITIGAGTTWHEIDHHAAIRSKLAPLSEVAREIGALQIQARATIGGNIGTSSPVGDSLPVLLALDAELEVSSMNGTRRVAYRDWCTGYRTTKMLADELIVAVHVPIPDPAQRLVWRKVGTRRAQSISKMLGAAAITLDGNRVAEARVALGAVANRPIRIDAVEQAVRGLTLGQAGEAARHALATAIQPIDDVRSTASYRLEVAQNVVARFFATS